MKIAVAADHRGFGAKRKLLPLLKQMGHDPEDFGCDGTSAATDYPDFAIRAALAHDEVTARLSREHNHCNVLCLGSDLLNENEIRKIISVFLTTPFGEGRHARRVEKLKQFEQDHRNPGDSSQWSSASTQPPPA